MCHDCYQVFLYRLFIESEESDDPLMEPHTIKMEWVRQAFPNLHENGVRKRLKLMADFQRVGRQWYSEEISVCCYWLLPRRIWKWMLDFASWRETTLWGRITFDGDAWTSLLLGLHVGSWAKTQGHYSQCVGSFSLHCRMLDMEGSHCLLKRMKKMTENSTMRYTFKLTCI